MTPPPRTAAPVCDVTRLHELSADALWALGDFIQQEKQRRAPEVYEAQAAAPDAPTILGAWEVIEHEYPPATVARLRAALVEDEAAPAGGLREATSNAPKYTYIFDDEGVIHREAVALTRGLRAHTHIVNGQVTSPGIPTSPASPSAAPLDVWPQRLDGHKPRWLQDRDDPDGMWTCGCGKTFGPDDFEGYHAHLREVGAPAMTARDVLAALVEACDPGPRTDIRWTIGPGDAFSTALEQARAFPRRGRAAGRGAVGAGAQYDVANARQQEPTDGE